MTRRERETCGMLGGEGRGGATVPAQYEWRHAVKRSERSRRRDFGEARLFRATVQKYNYSMLCCASKKALGAVAEPIEYASEPELVKKEMEPQADDAKPFAGDNTAATGTCAPLTVEAPLSPEKNPKPVPKLEEPTPLQSISISLGSLFEKVAESERGLIEAADPAAAPAAAPPAPAPVAGAPAAAAFETSSTGAEETGEAATESTASAPIVTAPAAEAPTLAAAAPAPEVVQSL